MRDIGHEVCDMHDKDGIKIKPKQNWQTMLIKDIGS